MVVPRATAAKKTAAKKTTPAKKTTTKKTAAKKATTPKPSEMDYGYAKAFLNAHPDVHAKIKLAVKQGWTAARLEAEIKTTNWWRKRTESQRQADIESTSNPAEWNRKIDAKANALKTQAASMGITLSDADAKTAAGNFLRNGSSDGEMQTWLGARFTMPANEDAPITGGAGQTVDTLQSMASAYGVHLDEATTQKYVRQVLQGTTTAEGLVDVFREQAKVLYPSIADYLDKNPGATTSDYVQPYFQVASRELGLPTTEMDLTDSKWSKVLSGQTGAPMSVDEWTTTIRTQPEYRWDQTSGAVDTAAQMATALQRSFGAAG